LLLAVIPFTLFMISPTNEELESDDLDVSSAKAEQLDISVRATTKVLTTRGPQFPESHRHFSGYRVYRGAP
jgi:hypothetical protein